MEAGGEDLNYCYQCGRCTSACPWGLVMEFNPRKMIRLAQMGLEGLESEDLWLCTTCGTCVRDCPREVGIIDLMKAMRNIIVKSGSSPPALRTAIGSVNSHGNPFSEKRESRADWAIGIEEARDFQEGTDFLLFVCCSSAYDPQNQKTAIDLCKVLDQSGIDFGIIGREENCCGESIRKIGDESLFTEISGKNTRLFERLDVRKIICTSPHCYHTFNNDYPLDSSGIYTMHYTQIMAELIEKGDLRFSRHLEQKVTYHDPCYLGRHNGIFDAPRKILEAIPGVELVEMERTRERSLCCGGGGGGIWIEIPKGKRFSEMRIEEAIATGAETLITACPYCFSLLEEARLSLNAGEAIKVMELPELIIGAL